MAFHGLLASYDEAEYFAAAAVISTIIVTVLWLVIAWRAMRAHERIAEAASQWVRQQPRSRGPNISHNIQGVHPPTDEKPT